MSKRFGAVGNGMLAMLALAVVMVLAGIRQTSAQWLPDEARLGDAAGSWVVDQNYKTSIGGAYTLGYIRVLVQSDGTVFHRKFFDSGQPATPWCLAQFTAEEMKKMRGAVAISKPSVWASGYGQWINIYAPFRVLVITRRGPKGEVSEYQTRLFRFNELPADVSALSNATDDAGTLAFGKCAER